MSSNAADAPGDVPGNGPDPHLAEDTGRQRSERLRQRRDAAGLAQVSGWVPKNRRAYAREVIAALARGANSLPPDPEQAAVLEAAQTDAVAARLAEAEARAALAVAEGHAQALAAELGDARAASMAAEATARAEVEALKGRERAAQEAAEALRGELEGIKSRGGWRGVLLRLAGARTATGRSTQ